MANEVATLDQAKDYLKVDGSGEDEMIKRLISAATKIAEDFTGRVFISRAITETHVGDGAEELRFYKQPVSEISEVKVSDTVITSYTDWSHIGRIKVSGGWGEGAIIEVTYTAGYGADIPTVQTALPELLMAILLIVSDFYENRSDKGGSINIAGIGSISYNLPSRAERILRPLAVEMFT